MTRPAGAAGGRAAGAAAGARGRAEGRVRSVGAALQVPYLAVTVAAVCLHLATLAPPGAASRVLLHALEVVAPLAAYSICNPAVQA